MGNCLRAQEQNVRFKKIDVDEAPALAHQHHHHAVSDTGSSNPNLRKKVRFADVHVEEVGNPSLRVKVVISKQKLKEIIANGGMVCEVLQNQENEVVGYDCCEEGSYKDKACKPALKSIPEAECNI